MNGADLGKKWISETVTAEATKFGMEVELRWESEEDQLRHPLWVRYRGKVGRKPLLLKRSDLEYCPTDEVIQARLKEEIREHLIRQIETSHPRKIGF